MRRADKRQMHERLREHALVAWEAVQNGLANPLVERISADPDLQTYLTESQLRSLMDASQHVGDAPQRARRFAEKIRFAGLSEETQNE